MANKAADSVLVLPESSATLELLLQYMYNQPQPDLSELAFPALLALAEAAERYQVYAALEICKVYLRCVTNDTADPCVLISISHMIPDHPLQVLTFALKHRRTSLMDEAAKETIGLPLADMLAVLQPEHFITWV